MLKRSQYFILSLVGLALAAIIACQWAFFVEQKRHAKASRDWVRHTDHVIDTLENMFGKVRDSELGQRGFLITGYEVTLNPHKAAVGKGELMDNVAGNMGNYDARTLPQLRQDIRRLLSDNPSQLARFAVLENLIDQKLEQSERMIAVRRDQGVQAAIALAQKEQFRFLMRHIRTQLSGIIAVENDLLSKRTARDAAIDGKLTSFIILSAILAYGGLMLALALIVISARRTRLAEQRLHVKEGNFRAVAENGMDAFFLFHVTGEPKSAGEDLILEYANPVAVQGMDMPYDQSIGRSLREALPHDDTLYATERYLELYHRRMPHQHEYCVISGPWAGRCFQRQAIPLADGIAIICRDITAQKQMERMKNEFVSTVSHELRTPLTSIRGSLGLILGGIAGPVAEQARGLLTIAHNNCERLVRLINDILDIEKIEAGSMSFHCRPVALLPFLRQAADTNQAYAEKHQARIELNAEGIGEPDQIHADPDRLMQIVTNLLSNAAKFSPEGGVVMLRCRREGGRVRIEVEDRGPGIAPEFQARLFERFAQGDASDTRQKGGTGLGLSIVKAMAERMQGVVDFDSALGAGSRFWVAFPLLDGAVRLPTIEREALPRVLICEDDGDVAQLLEMILERAGFASDIAMDSESAMRRLLAQNYVAMTLDLLLPDAYGMELLASIRTHERLAGLPIVVISARAELERGLNGDEGVVDWMSKPIDTERLIGHLRTLVAGKARPRVLHVEDDDGIAEILRLALGEAEVVRAATLAEARAMIGEDFDLAVLDVGLPDGEGTALVPLLRERMHALPIVLFSAAEVAPNMRDSVSAALVKSRTSEDALVHTIRALIARGPTRLEHDA